MLSLVRPLFLLLALAVIMKLEGETTLWFCSIAAVGATHSCTCNHFAAYASYGVGYSDTRGTCQDHRNHCVRGDLRLFAPDAPLRYE